MGHRKTPLMGWASWNVFRTDISEMKLKEQAELLVRSGLASHGYTYFNIDDGFFGGRGVDGRIEAHKQRFPNGMKVMAEYVHSLGLSAGIYADAGDNTCGFYYDHEEQNGEKVGLYLHEKEDLITYLVDWGYDYIKVDWCGGLRLGLDEQDQYTKIGNIIRELELQENKDLVFNICRWQFPGKWATEIADSWRTGSDITPDFDSILHQIDMIKPLRQFCEPGHVNDLDMLQVGNGMTPLEEQTHFAMWCMMSTPLIIGCDLNKISNDTFSILMNDELIAINQDKACLQAYVVKHFYNNGQLAGEIWIKNLQNIDSSEKAVAFLNRSNHTINMQVKLEELGLGGSVIEIRDVINHEEIKYEGEFQHTIKAHGCNVYRMKAEYAIKIPDRESTYKEMEIERITFDEAIKHINNGACWIDVREEIEFQKKHFENAVHISYTDIHAIAPDIIPNQEKTYIVYCNTGKRSSQAAKCLIRLGYHNVYYYSMS